MKYYKFTQLAIELYRKKIQHTQAAEALGISLSAFTRKLDAQRPWTLDEMYKLIDLLEVTTDSWEHLFPNIYKEA